jgi:hypothetical protein
MILPRLFKDLSKKVAIKTAANSYPSDETLPGLLHFFLYKEKKPAIPCIEQGIPNVIQESVLAKLAPRILIRRSRRTNSSLLEIGGYFCGSKAWDASAAPILESRSVYTKF